MTRNSLVKIRQVMPKEAVVVTVDGTLSMTKCGIILRKVNKTTPSAFQVYSRTYGVLYACSVFESYTACCYLRVITAI